MLDEPEIEVRHIPGPREGWMSVILLGVMLLSLCWAVQAAGWLDTLEFLVRCSLQMPSWAAVACYRSMLRTDLL